MGGHQITRRVARFADPEGQQIILRESLLRRSREGRRSLAVVIFDANAAFVGRHSVLLDAGIACQSSPWPTNSKYGVSQRLLASPRFVRLLGFRQDQDIARVATSHFPERPHAPVAVLSLATLEYGADAAAVEPTGVDPDLLSVN